MRHVPLLAILSLLLPACVPETDEGKGTTLDEDTGTPEEVEITSWTEWTIPAGTDHPDLHQGPIQGRTDIGGNTACVARKPNDLDGLTVTGVSVHGSGRMPESVRLSLAEMEEPDSGSVVRVTGESPSFWLPPEDGSVDNDWSFISPATDPMTCSESSCGTGNWELDVYPMPADLGSETVAWNCEPYGDITVSLTTLEEGSASEESTAADCTAGSGTFRLVPVLRKDDNFDTYGRHTYVPMQISGTGTMTNKAEVSQITLVSNGGYPLRVLKGGADVAYTPQDFLAQPSLVSVPITGTHSFASGVLKGRPRFVHPPIVDGVAIDARVSMTWTCGGTTTTSDVPAGYQIAANTMGCGPMQKLVVRPYDGSIRVEPYGDPSYAVRAPLDANGNFSVAIGNFTASARLISYNANSASMQLLSATVGGSSICEPGTYTLSPE